MQEMTSLPNLISSTLHLFYPHHCIACGSDLLPKTSLLCVGCISSLPHTRFAFYQNNDIENIFRGRLNLRAAHSEFYFSKGQIIQRLIHHLKYKANQEIGQYLGRLLGKSLLESSRFMNLNYVIPLPLSADKQLKRGYNQAAVICKGISEATNIPVLEGNVIRQRSTETQTRKHRAERWQNVAGSFAIKNIQTLSGKNLLLVDDVITTGATLEACGHALLNIPGTTLSVAALAHASK